MKYIIDIPENMVVKSALNSSTLGIPVRISATDKEYIIPTQIQLEPYEKQQEKIEIGDEVRYEDIVGSSKFIVLREDERYYYGIHSGGDSGLSIGEEDYCWKKDNVKKNWQILWKCSKFN